MNGIEILSSAEVGVGCTTNWWLAGFIWIGIVFIGGLIGFLTDNVKRAVSTAYGCVVGSLVGILFWLFIGAMASHPTAYEVHYKVTIDNSVSLNEFLDKYEIIDQEGKIYTIKERE